jgi:hypothetical protein
VELTNASTENQVHPGMAIDFCKKNLKSEILIIEAIRSKVVGRQNNIKILLRKLENGGV